jgi:hypothetical protein
MLFIAFLTASSLATAQTQPVSPFKTGPSIFDSIRQPQQPVVVAPQYPSVYDQYRAIQQPRVQIQIDARDWDNPAVQRALTSEAIREAGERLHYERRGR